VKHAEKSQHDVFVSANTDDQTGSIVRSIEHIFLHCGKSGNSFSQISMVFTNLFEPNLDRM